MKLNIVISSLFDIGNASTSLKAVILSYWPVIVNYAQSPINSVSKTAEHDKKNLSQ